MSRDKQGSGRSALQKGPDAAGQGFQDPGAGRGRALPRSGCRATAALAGFMRLVCDHPLFANWGPRNLLPLSEGEPVVWSPARGQVKTSVPDAEVGQRVNSPFLCPFFCPGPRSAGRGPPSSERTTCFTDSNVNLTQKRPHRHSLNQVRPNTPGACGPGGCKLTLTGGQAQVGVAGWPFPRWPLE